MFKIELERIWKKKSYLLVLLGIVLLQLILLWYETKNGANEIPYSAHKKLNKYIENMSEEEKNDFFLEEKERLGAMRLGSMRIEDSSAIKFTDNVWMEYEFINRTYADFVRIYGYKDYIRGIEDNKVKLNNISIFSSCGSEDGFAKKNIEKSAKNHEGMESISPKFFSTIGIEKTLSFSIADIFLFILAAYFAMLLIWEEKQNGLCGVTRAAKRGRGRHIAAKLAALTTSALILSALFLVIKYVWYGIKAGFVNLSLPMQSVAAYSESSLRLSLGGLIILVWLSKAIAAFLVGLVVLFAAQRTKLVWIPLLSAVLLVTGEAILYNAIPLHTAKEGFKFLSLFGLLKSDLLYGSYLNVSFFGKPVSAGFICLFTQLVLIAALVLVNILTYLFWYQDKITTRKGISIKTRILGKNLFCQEAYKIFVMNKAVIVVIAGLLAMKFYQDGIEYRVTEQEKYYRELMLELEGDLNDEKSNIIQNEQNKYEAAEAQIDMINQMEAEGKINKQNADDMKRKYQYILCFKPQFDKVLKHLDSAEADGTPFLYDTGYRKLFWLDGNKKVLQVELLIAATVIIFAFSSVFSMEEEKQSWTLLGATRLGRKKIVKAKLSICFASAIALAVAGWLFRFLSINSVYRMKQIGFPGKCILENNGGVGSIFLFLLVHIFVHVMLYTVITIVVLFISSKRKRTIEVYLYSAVCIIVPLLLCGKICM